MDNQKALSLDVLTCDNSLVAINEQLSTIESIDDAVELIAASASDNRRKWIATALLVHKALTATSKAVTRKQARERVRNLEDKLHYKTASIYNFSAVGDLILKGLADKRYEKVDDLPYTMDEFKKMYTPKKDKPVLKIISDMVCIGNIKRDGIKYAVYSAIKNFTSGDPVAVTIIVRATKDPIKEINISVTEKDGKKITHYMLYDGTEIDPTFIAF